MDEDGVKIAVVGSGRWGLIVAGELRKAGRLAALVSRSPEDAAHRETATTLGVPSISVETFCDSSIPAAWIATPIAIHAEVAQKVIEADKHVLLEKPASGIASTALALAESARQKNCVFASGYVFLYDPAYRELKRRIEATTPAEIRCIWRKHGTFGESIGLNLLTHHLSIALDLLGDPEQAHIITEENHSSARLAYPHSTFTSDIDRESQDRLHTIEVSLPDGDTYRFADSKLFLSHRGGAYQTVFNASESALQSEIHAFADAVKAGTSRDLPSGDQFAARVLALYERGLAAR